MTQAAIAAEIHQPLDVHRHFAAQIALDQVVAVDRLADLQDFGVGQLGDAALCGDIDLLADLAGVLGADAMMYCSAMTTRLVGMFTPAIRAIVSSP